MPQILSFRADICCFHIGDIFQGKHLAVNCHKGSLQIYQPHGGCHCAHIDVTSHFILAYFHGHHSSHSIPCQKACWCQYWGSADSGPQGIISHQWLSDFFKVRQWCFQSNPGSLQIRVFYHLVFSSQWTLGWSWAGVILVTAQLFCNPAASSSSPARAVTIATLP